VYYKDGVTSYLETRAGMGTTDDAAGTNYAIQDSATAFSSTGERFITGDASTLTFAASIAFAAAALTF
jgi:hypothetical protein